MLELPDLLVGEGVDLIDISLEMADILLIYRLIRDVL